MYTVWVWCVVCRRGCRCGVWCVGVGVGVDVYDAGAGVVCGV